MTQPSIWARVQQAITQADTQREAIEERRSLHRNGNRVLVLIVALFVSTAWPLFALHVMHSTFGLAWTVAIQDSADLLVTLWAMHRRY